MPTIECLDERSKAILSSINELKANFERHHAEFKEALEDMSKALEARIESHERDTDRRLNVVTQDILAIKLEHENERGRRSVLIWAGGIMLSGFSAVAGAIGNLAYTWLIERGQHVIK